MAYDKDEVSVFVNGGRVEQLKNFDPPDESYDRSFDQTVGEDDNVALSDSDPELEGTIEVAPTSGTITEINELLRDDEEVPITIRFPSEDSRSSETYVRSRFTEKTFSNSFDDDSESPPNREYTFIADDIDD